MGTGDPNLGLRALSTDDRGDTAGGAALRGGRV